jgi:NAD(P)-dependent dehydrogenase (short-subunit alcohol dehydrogenase family)
MQRTIVATVAIAVCCWMAPQGPARAEASGSLLPGLAVLDFNYVDTSGESRDQNAEHKKRLDAFMLAFRQDIAASEKYLMVAATCRPVSCQVGQSPLSELQDAARDAGAKILLVGGTHKMSTLIQNARVLAVDVETGAVVLDRLMTFRGDTDEAWQRAETFLSQQVTASPAGGARPAPIRLAVFDFELEDASAGASLTSAADAAQLGMVTAEVRRLIGQSGRFRLVDADTGAIDRMLNLNVNVVMKNVHDVLPHMIARRTGDIIVTSSLAAHFPTPWEPVYASSKWAINCFVQTVRRQVFKHGIRVARSHPAPSSPHCSRTGRPKS